LGAQIALNVFLRHRLKELPMAANRAPSVLPMMRDAVVSS